MQTAPESAWPILLGLLSLALFSLGLGLSWGSLVFSPQQLWNALFDAPTSLPGRIIHELRLPRVLSAFAIGGLLALSGVLVQVLLRNPLGDPYVLGLSGGAALAVLGGMLMGLPLSWHMPLSFIGALFSMLSLFMLARMGRVWNTQRLLLTGVVLGAGWSAFISFLLSVAPSHQLPGMLFWLMGDLSDAYQPSWPGLALGLGLIVSLSLAPQLNLARRNPLQAQALGVAWARLQAWIFVLASGMTAIAVSHAGSIGFIGLIAPHMVRLLGARDHRILLPGAALAGGSLLLLADTAARSLLAPMQLPVGVLTALLGVPTFLFLLRKA